MVFLTFKKNIVCQSERVCVSADLPHDVRPGERRGADLQPHRHDAAALPLGRLPAVPRAAAAGLPARLLGVAQRDGGKCRLRSALSPVSQTAPRVRVTVTQYSSSSPPYTFADDFLWRPSL